MACSTGMELQNYWSLVITDVPDEIDERHFHPYLASPSAEDGHQPTWYDSKPIANPYDAVSHGPISDYVIVRWQTPLPIYEGLAASPVRFLNAVKKVLNQIKCSLCFHDGNADPSCKFQGKHLHVMWATSYDSRPYDMSWFRNFKKVHEQITCEKVRMPDRFAKYMTKPPRIYLGTNDHSIYAMVSQASPFGQETAALEAASVSGTTRRKTVQYMETEDLIILMKKYNTQDRLLLTQRAKDDAQDSERLKELVRSPRWSVVLRCAKEELSTESKISLSDYYVWFMKQKASANQPMMSVMDTRDFYMKWCQEQNVDPIKLILEMYCVLRMVNTKKNTLYFQGRSNAGKTFLVQMMLPDPTVAGNHISSKEFAFQECVSKPLILINELTITNTAEVELYKYVLGGELVMVNIKNRAAEYLRRTPVIVTSNNAMWHNVLNEKDALKNRCFCHLNLKRSQVAADFSKKGIPNFMFLQQCFRYVTEVLKSRVVPSGEDIVSRPEFFAELPALTGRLEPAAATTTIIRSSAMQEILPADVVRELEATFSDDHSVQKVEVEVQTTPDTSDTDTQTELSSFEDEGTQTDGEEKVSTSMQTDRVDQPFQFRGLAAARPITPFDKSQDSRENPFSRRNTSTQSDPWSDIMPNSNQSQVNISEPGEAQEFDLFGDSYVEYLENNRYDDVSPPSSRGSIFDLPADQTDSLVLPETEADPEDASSDDTLIPPTPPAPARPTLRARRYFSRSRRPAPLRFVDDILSDDEVPMTSTPRSRRQQF